VSLPKHALPVLATLLGLGAMLAAPPGPARAQAQADVAAVDPSDTAGGALVLDDEILAKLDHPDPDIREAQTRELLGDLRVTPEHVLDALERARTWEQRHRLIEIARHHFIREVIARGDRSKDAAAIGIRLDTAALLDDAATSRYVVRVDATFPGFPGHAVLRPGDLVLAIPGTGPLDAGRPTDTFTRRIQSMNPGDELTLDIQRDGEIQRVSMRLGSLQALHTIYPSDGFLQALHPDVRREMAKLEAAIRDRLPHRAPLPFAATEPGKGDPDPHDADGSEPQQANPAAAP